MFFLCIDKFKRKEDGSLPGCRKTHHISGCRERISLSASYGGSLTVEAACVLPVFVYAVLLFCYFFRVIATAQGVAEGLQDAGKQMAIYAYAKEAVVGEKKEEAAGIVSLLYVKNRIRQAAGTDMPSVSLLHSSVLKGDEMIDLIAECKFRWRVPFFAPSGVSVIQRARIRAWTGRKGTQNSGGEEKDSVIVYVTVNGSVYHRDRECSHIRLSVRTAERTQVSKLRNESGGKYYPCESCGGGNGSQVYITDTGDRYHSSVTCSRLKRGVLAVPLSQVESWPPCSRCGR